MSYAHKIDGMVGQHVADWQLEVILANRLRDQSPQRTLANGYAKGAYRPRRSDTSPRCHRFVSHPEGVLSNGVPKVLGLDFEGQYPLGAYHPR